MQLFPERLRLRRVCLRRFRIALRVEAAKAFEGRELWGPDADPTIRISIDAFEPYLERA